MSNFKDNSDLFQYIIREALSHGGDGNVAVLFKQQNPDEITEEFESFMRRTDQVFWKRSGTNVFYGIDDSNENIAFAAATSADGTPYDPHDHDNTLSWRWTDWDTFIITW